MKKTNVEVNVMMFGGRRVGKTSILATMQSCFNDEFGASNLMITPADTETMFALEEKQNEIESYYGKNKRNFIPEGEYTLDMMKYRIDVRLKSKMNGDLTINFIDYPGEWLGRPEKAELLKNQMQRSNVIIVAIDTPYLMEETADNDRKTLGQYNDYRNYCKRIGNMLMQCDKKEEPIMILFVPLKCEKYMHNREMDVVSAKIKEAYKSVFNLYSGINTKGAQIAITPVLTTGNIEFAKFMRNSETQEIIIEDGYKTPLQAEFYFPKMNVTKPEPKYCEQPMVYILLYLFEMAKRKKEKTNKNLNIVQKWLQDNLWDPILKMPSISDFMNEKSNLQNKIKKKEDGYEIINDPLKF